MTHITRLRITSFCGIETLDVEIPPAGAVFAGKGGLGKTSALNAIRAALGARNVSPSAIRVGSDRAEILVDVDDVTVRRLITKSGSPNLTITTKDGFKRSKPQAFLNDLVGGAPLDPLEFFLAKPEKQRAMILDVLPIRVKVEDLARWIPAEYSSIVTPDVIEKLGDVHGLELVATIHKTFYELRRIANAKAEDLGAKLVARREAFETTSQSIDVALAEKGETVDVAALDAAVRELQARDVRATRQAAQFSEQRAKVETLRARAAGVREVDIEEMKRRHAQTSDSNHAFLQRVSEAERAFLDAKARYDELRAEMEKRTSDELAQGRAIESAQRSLEEAAALLERADEIEKTIAASTETPVTVDELTAAVDARNAGQRAAEESARLRAVRAEEDAIIALNQEAFDAGETAVELSDIVDRLRVDAPKELLAAQNGIPGVGVTDDGIVVDGKPLALLCGKERMRLAIEIARRSNPKARILVVDGLEQIAPDEQADFMKEATRDGYQLIASKVQNGALVVEHVVAETSEAAQ